MLRTAGLLATLALVISACSQAPADVAAPTLEPQFGTADADYGTDIVALPAGGVVALSDQSGNLENGLYDKVLLQRFDASGKALWTREISSYACDYDRDYECGNEFRYAVALHADARGYTYVLDGFHYIVGDEAFQQDYGITKVDSSGKIVKRFQVGATGSYFGEEGRYSFLDTAVDKDGNVYVAKAQFDFSFDFEETTRTNVVAKYSTSGGLLWQRPSTVGVPKAVAVSGNGYVYVAGSAGVAKYTGSGTLVWTKPGAATDVAAVGTNTVYVRNLTTVRKLDGGGKQLWSKTQTGLSGLVVGDMTTDSSANVYLTGKYNASSSNRDAFTRKLSSNGGTVFTKTFGTSAYDDARGVATLNGSEIYVTGATKGALAHPFRGGDTDGYVRKLNSSGNPVWTR